MSIWLLVAVAILVACLRARHLIRLIEVYQRVAPARVRAACRFQPTCSEYAKVALRSRGMLHGLPMIARRLWRCRPPHGGEDHPSPNPL